MDFNILIAFSLATAALAISPGPDNIYVLTQSLANGFKYGLATTAGLITGCLVHTTLLAFGVSVLIKNNPELYLGIKLFGAGYLLFLAVKIYVEKPPENFTGGAAPKKSLGALFRQGFIMNVLNPKVALFFLAFFPGFLFSDSINTIIQFYILGFLFMLISFSVFTGIALLAGKFSTYLKSKANPYRFFKWLQITVFVGIAAFLFIS